jgi:hypothetical protein
MKLPFAIPSETFYGALTYLGLAAVIYAFLVPTDLYDSYKKLYRDVEEEQAVLAVEQQYLQQERQRLGDRVSTEVTERLIAREKELAIREARLEINQRRVADLRKAWHKSRLASWLTGLGGIAAAVTGFTLWRRREERKNPEPKS